MPRSLKIVLASLFVLAVAFFVAKGCWRGGFAQKKAPVKVSVRKKTVPGPAQEKNPLPAPPAGEAKMAIILDDWGNNLALVKDAVDIQRPLTLSVLPHLVHSREIAETAKKNGLGVMLHMPMQAKNAKAPAEPRTIQTTMPDTQILEYLDQALESVPEAEGVNNHQGSAATSDERVMNTVLTHLKSKGLFFVDSQVISTSVGRKTAVRIGIPFTHRDVFIDNTPTVVAVKLRLAYAQKIALAHGRVVIIGHDKKPTLQAIAEMVPELEKAGVKLVLVKELLE